jgi:hypothetical protein
LQRPGVAFAEIDEGALNGYTTRDTLQIAVGDVFMARSRVVCSSLSLPIYGKLEVIGVDLVARTVTVQVLADQNCGYVGLLPGLPEK